MAGHNKKKMRPGLPAGHYLADREEKYVIRHQNMRSQGLTGLFGPIATSDANKTLVLGIGQENHNRLSDELNRLIIDCTIGFLLAMSNNIQQVP